MRKNSCPNLNHRRSDVPFHHCLACGEVVCGALELYCSATGARGEGGALLDDDDDDADEEAQSGAPRVKHPF